MINVTGPGFAVQMPDGSTDCSTYAFALPSLAEFKPSVVIKAEQKDVPKDPLQHMIEQRSALREHVENFEVITERAETHQGLARVWSVFEWSTSGMPRVRQKQVFIFVPRRRTIYTITATDAAATFALNERTFDAVIGSFAAQNG